MHQSVDFDLHSLVGVRLLDPAPGDITAVARRLGPPSAALGRRPDIVIRFVERLAVSSPVRYLDEKRVGFTDEAFLVTAEEGHRVLRAQIPFEQIGRRCEIVCESGIGAVPLLPEILNLTLLGKGTVSLHASAFTYEGKGIVTTGWAGGGKTGILVAFMARGARYIGDDQILLGGDGCLYGFRLPLVVRERYLQDCPEYGARVEHSDRARLAAIRLSLRLTGRKRWRPTRALVNRQRVRIAPERLFGPERCAFTGRLHKLFFMLHQESGEVTIDRSNPDEFIHRLVLAQQPELQELISCYRKFRFAFPEVRNEFIECAEQRQRQLLRAVLADKEAYLVGQPPSAPAPALFDAVAPVVARP